MGGSLPGRRRERGSIPKPPLRCILPPRSSQSDGDTHPVTTGELKHDISFIWSRYRQYQYYANSESVSNASVVSLQGDMSWGIHSYLQGPYAAGPCFAPPWLGSRASTRAAYAFTRPIYRSSHNRLSDKNLSALRYKLFTFPLNSDIAHQFTSAPESCRPAGNQVGLESTTPVSIQRTQPSG